MLKSFTSDELGELAQDPSNQVLTFADGPGDPSAWTMARVRECRNRLVQDIIRLRERNPTKSDVRIRLMLMRQDPMWKEFSQRYPLFWEKCTSSASTRNDFIALERILIAHETEPDPKKRHETIMNDLMALFFDPSRPAKTKQEQIIRDRARLKQEYFSRHHTNLPIPNEILHIRPRSRHSLVEQAAQVRASYRDPVPISSSEAMKARQLLEYRAHIVKTLRCIPRALEAEQSFFPRYERAGSIQKNALHIA